MRRCVLALMLVTGPFVGLFASAEADFSAEDYGLLPVTEEAVRVQLTARYHTVLSAGLSAKVERLPLREGQRFGKGDLLLQLDCAVERAQWKKAKALLHVAARKAEVSRRLAELNSIGQLEQLVAEADAEKASAELEVMEATVKACRIQAPFTGRIASLTVAEHQYVKQGTELMEILGDRQLEVEMIVPSHNLANLEVGERFQVTVDEVGKSYPAKIITLGAKIDPVSQSLKVIAEIDGQFPELLPGMSGIASFDAM